MWSKWLKGQQAHEKRAARRGICCVASQMGFRGGLQRALRLMPSGNLPTSLEDRAAAVRLPFGFAW
jgi:hypothetical protein